MRFTAKRFGDCSFSMTAEILMPIKKGDTPFVFLESLEFFGPGKTPLIRIVVSCGRYVARVLKPLQGCLKEVNEFENVFFGSIYGFSTMPVGCGFVLTDDMGNILQESISNIAYCAYKSGSACISINGDTTNPIYVDAVKEVVKYS
jgi:hypothetical protein